MRASEVASSSKHSPNRLSALAVAGFIGGAALSALAIMPARADDWNMFGQNVANTASSPQNSIPVAKVASLKPKWVFTTGGDVSARASVSNGVAYFPDWGGNLWAVAAGNGKKVWSHQLSDYFTGAVSGSIHSRTTPAVSSGTLYVGELSP